MVIELCHAVHLRWVWAVRDLGQKAIGGLYFGLLVILSGSVGYFFRIGFYVRDATFICTL